jgi:hypothetical protein
MTGSTAGPAEELGEELLSTDEHGMLFAGENGILFSDAWGVGGVVRLVGIRSAAGARTTRLASRSP